MLQTTTIEYTKWELPRKGEQLLNNKGQTQWQIGDEQIKQYTKQTTSNEDEDEQ